MSNAIAQLLEFFRRAVSAVFGFIETVWNWAALQVQHLAAQPWQSWPIAKQILLAVVVLAIAVVLFKVAAELWAVGERLINAFATLFAVLVRTLPLVAIAGVIAVGGIWALNNFDLSGVRLPVAWQTSTDQPVRR